MTDAGFVFRAARVNIATREMEKYQDCGFHTALDKDLDKQSIKQTPDSLLLVS